jgi:hypothetical protein
MKLIKLFNDAIQNILLYCLRSEHEAKSFTPPKQPGVKNDPP